jgi:hypothetical protein
MSAACDWVTSGRRTADFMLCYRFQEKKEGRKAGTSARSIDGKCQLLRANCLCIKSTIQWISASAQAVHHRALAAQCKLATGVQGTQRTQHERLRITQRHKLVNLQSGRARKAGDATHGSDWRVCSSIQKEWKATGVEMAASLEAPRTEDAPTAQTTRVAQRICHANHHCTSITSSRSSPCTCPQCR